MEGNEGPRGAVACGKGPTMGSGAGPVTFGSALGTDTETYERWPLMGQFGVHQKHQCT